MSDLISVIVPVYKAEKYLTRCVDSILTQTYQNLDVILVDDGSPDRSPAICDAYAKKDSRVRVIHKKNAGVSAARNAGIEVAKGDFVAFVDSDDWIEKEMYTYLHALLLRSNADIAQCGMQEGTDLFLAAEPPVNEQIVDVDRFFREFFQIGSSTVQFYLWDKLYRMRVISNVRFPVGISLAEDTQATFEIALNANKIVRTSRVFYHYFTNFESATHGSFSSKDLDLLTVWDRIVEISARKRPDLLPYAQLNRARTDLTILWRMAANGSVTTDATFKEVEQELLSNLQKNRKMLFHSCLRASRKMVMLAFCVNYAVTKHLLRRYFNFKSTFSRILAKK